MPSTPLPRHCGTFLAVKEGLLSGLLLSALTPVGLTTLLVLMVSSHAIRFLCTALMLAAIWFSILLMVSFRVAKQTRSSHQGALAGRLAGIMGIVVSPPITLLTVIHVLVSPSSSIAVPVGIPVGLVLVAFVLPAFVVMGIILAAIGTVIGAHLGEARATKPSRSSHPGYPGVSAGLQCTLGLITTPPLFMICTVLFPASSTALSTLALIVGAAIWSFNSP